MTTLNQALRMMVELTDARKQKAHIELKELNKKLHDYKLSSISGGSEDFRKFMHGDISIDEFMSGFNFHKSKLGEASLAKLLMSEKKQRYDELLVTVKKAESELEYAVKAHRSAVVTSIDNFEFGG